MKSFSTRVRPTGHIPRRGTLPVMLAALFLMMIAHCGARTDSSATVEMSLEEAVHLALRNNRSVQIAGLQQTVAKYNNWVAQREFHPRVSLQGSLVGRDLNVFGSNESSSRSSLGRMEPYLINKLPTGGEFRFAWEQSFEREHHGDTNSREPARLLASFRQPLLRGGGLTAGTAAKVRADRYYQSSVLNMRSTLISTITRVITAYRALLKSEREVAIAHMLLERARQNVVVNRALIDAGRMAAGDIIQAEADVANQELSLHYARNRRDASRLNLLDLLELDLHLDIRPTEALETSPVKTTLADCLQTALAHRTDYLSLLLQMDNADLDEALARNRQRWDLNLTLDYQRDEDQAAVTHEGRDEWRGMLTLNIPIYGDWTRKQELFSATTRRRQLELELEERRDQIEAELINALRDVDSIWREAQLAGRARELTQRKMENEEENLRLGRSSNFALITYRHDLARAELNELNARIGYLNALAHLDQLVGSTLETWQVDWDAELAELVMPE